MNLYLIPQGITIPEGTRYRWLCDRVDLLDGHYVAEVDGTLSGFRLANFEIVTSVLGLEIRDGQTDTSNCIAPWEIAKPSSQYHKNDSEVLDSLSENIMPENVFSNRVTGSRLSLVKYYHSSINCNIFANHTFRIGTLYDFRKEEKHGSKVGDKAEGTQTQFVDMSYKNDRKEIPPILNDWLIVGPNAQMNFGPGVVFNFIENCPNCYIFCFSSEYNANAMKDLKCDSYYTVTNPIAFLNSIDDTLRDEAKFIGLFPCVYTSRSLAHPQKHTFHSAIVKDPDYGYQMEYRAIWQPYQTEISPKIITCHEAIKYCDCIPENSLADLISNKDE